MALALSSALAQQNTTRLTPTLGASSFARSALQPIRVAPRLLNSPALSLQAPSSSRRLVQLQAMPDNQEPPHLANSANNDSVDDAKNDSELSTPTSSREPKIDDKGIEILDCQHLGSFITEDGYPLDIFLDNILIDKDYSDINSIYDLKYSLNHDDRNGHRTLHISDHFPTNDSFYAKIMRDTIYGQWTEEDGAPVLDLAMHVNDNAEGKGPMWESAAKNSELIPPPLSKELAKIGGEMRKKIFKDHVQDSLQAMAIGTQQLLDKHPELKEAKTQLRFLSELDDVAETIDSGSLESHLDKPLLDKKSPIAQAAANVQIWGEAMSSSTKAMRQLLDAILKPESLGPLLKNPKTLAPTLVLLIALGLVAANKRSSNP